MAYLQLGKGVSREGGGGTGASLTSPPVTSVQAFCCGSPVLPPLESGSALPSSRLAAAAPEISWRTSLGDAAAASATCTVIMVQFLHCTIINLETILGKISVPDLLFTVRLGFAIPTNRCESVAQGGSGH